MTAIAKEAASGPMAGAKLPAPTREEGDNGGVHINSGIPNHAFFLVATSIGGHAWEAPGRIWCESLLASSATTQLRRFLEAKG